MKPEYRHRRDDGQRSGTLRWQIGQHRVGRPSPNLKSDGQACPSLHFNTNFKTKGKSNPTSTARSKATDKSVRPTRATPTPTATPISTPGSTATDRSVRPTRVLHFPAVCSSQSHLYSSGFFTSPRRTGFWRMYSSFSSKLSCERRTWSNDSSCQTGPLEFRSLLTLRADAPLISFNMSGSA